MSISQRTVLRLQEDSSSFLVFSPVHFDCSWNIVVSFEPLVFLGKTALRSTCIYICLNFVSIVV